MNVWYKYRGIKIFFGYLSLFFLKINTLQAQTLHCNSTSSLYLSDIYKNFSQDRFNYATVNDYSGNSVTLFADIYRPLLSSVSKRATIVIFTGGGFKNTYITAPILRAWAKDFTSRGYNVIIPMYRTGWQGFDVGLCGAGTNADFIEAMYRALQDERRLLQYIRDNSTRWQIDTEAIFEMGYSAGALLVLGNVGGGDVIYTEAQQQNLGEMPQAALNVKGLITLTGAVVSRNYSEDIPPLLLLHGTCDNAVPMEEGRLAGCANLSYLYGSSTVYSDLRDKSCVQLEVFCNYGHDFRSGDDGDEIASSFTYISNLSSQFMYNILCQKNCTSTANAANDSLQRPTVYSCHPNVGNEFCTQWSKKEDNIQITPSVLNGDNILKILSQCKIPYPEASLVITNIIGSEVFATHISLPVGNTNTIIALPESLEKGVYCVYISTEKQILTYSKLLKVAE